MSVQELDFNRNFRLFITSKLPNPHYTPEISTQVTLVNFAVKEQGLEVRRYKLRPPLHQLEHHCPRFSDRCRPSCLGQWCSWRNLGLSSRRAS
jgi:hypothetical protein